LPCDALRSKPTRPTALTRTCTSTMVLSGCGTAGPQAGGAAGKPCFPFARRGARGPHTHGWSLATCLARKIVPAREVLLAYRVTMAPHSTSGSQDAARTWMFRAASLMSVEYATATRERACSGADESRARVHATTRHTYLLRPLPPKPFAAAQARCSAQPVTSSWTPCYRCADGLRVRLRPRGHPHARL
jgi:hypothetical protein